MDVLIPVVWLRTDGAVPGVLRFRDETVANGFGANPDATDGSVFVFYLNALEVGLEFAL